MKDGKIHYEIVTVLKPKTEDKDTILNKIDSMLTGMGATVAETENLGLKDLVYKIKDQSKGDFVVVNAESAKALKMKDFILYLNREPNVIRYLILKK